MSLVFTFPPKNKSIITDNDLGRGFSIDHNKKKKNYIFSEKNIIKKNIYTEYSNFTLIKDFKSLESLLNIGSETSLLYGILLGKNMKNYYDINNYINNDDNRTITFLFSKRITSKISELYKDDNPSIIDGNFDTIREKYGLFYINKIEYGSILEMKISISASISQIENIMNELNYQFISIENFRKCINSYIDLISIESSIISIGGFKEINNNNICKNSNSNSKLDDVFNLISSLEIDNSNLIPIKIELVPINSIDSISLSQHKYKLSIIGSKYWKIRQLIIQLKLLKNKIIVPELLKEEEKEVTISTSNINILFIKISKLIFILKKSIKEIISFFENDQFENILNYSDGSLINKFEEIIESVSTNLNKNQKVKLETQKTQETQELPINHELPIETTSSIKKIEFNEYIQFKNLSTSDQYHYKYCVNVENLKFKNELFQEFYNEIIKSFQDYNNNNNRSNEKRNKFYFMFVGMIKSGKTSIIEFLLNILTGQIMNSPYQLCVAENEDLGIDGIGNSKTIKVCQYEIEYTSNDDPQLQFSIVLIDTPGFSDSGGIGKDRDHISSILKQLLITIDTLDSISYVLPGSVIENPIDQLKVFTNIFSTLPIQSFNSISTFISFSDDSSKVNGIKQILSDKFTNIQYRPTMLMDNPIDKYLNLLNNNNNNSSIQFGQFNYNLKEFKEMIKLKSKSIQNFIIDRINSRSFFKIIDIQLLNDLKNDILLKLYNIPILQNQIIENTNQLISINSQFDKQISNRKHLLLIKKETEDSIKKFKYLENIGENLKSKYLSNIYELNGLLLKFSNNSILGNINLVLDSTKQSFVLHKQISLSTNDIDKVNLFDSFLYQLNSIINSINQLNNNNKNSLFLKEYDQIIFKSKENVRILRSIFGW